MRCWSARVSRAPTSTWSWTGCCGWSTTASAWPSTGRARCWASAPTSRAASGRRRWWRSPPAGSRRLMPASLTASRLRNWPGGTGAKTPGRPEAPRVRLYLCGVRGSTPAPGADFLRYGGHTSCVAIAHDRTPTLVLDAGTGLRQVTPLLGGQPFAGTILLSHLHWDHVHGLPFFTGGDRDDARASLLMPWQGPGASAEEVLARGMSPPHFPITPSGLRGAWTFGFAVPGPLKAEGFTVEA